MRCCPKCGAQYEDTDFRTMCGNCLVSLVASTAPAEPSEMAQVGPIIASSPLPTITSSATMTLPEITVPTMTVPEIEQPIPPTEVPQIPPPQPEPAPTPNPTEPQPPVIPAPSPQPVLPPVPTPQPISHPALSPEPKPTVRTAPRATVTTPTERKQTDAQEKERPLSGEEIGNAMAAVIGFRIGAVVAVVIALISLFNTTSSEFTFFTLIFDGGLIGLSVYLIRQAIYRSAIQRVKLVQLPGTQLGSMLCFDLLVGVLRTIPITESELRITAEEFTERGSGKNRTTTQQTIFSRTIPVCPPGQWPGRTQLTFHPLLTLPADGIPSFEGQHHHIKWSAQLWISIPGWYPDIRLRVPLVIPPVRVADKALPSSMHAFSLPNLASMQAQFSLDCPMDKCNRPILYAGRKTPFSLAITPRTKDEASKLLVELSYTITGDGGVEQSVVDRATCFTNGWKQEMRQQENSGLLVPTICPISYEGKHFQVHWSITVRNSLLWRKEQQIFEVIVLPDEVV